jgi:hypothetical protein
MNGIRDNLLLYYMRVTSGGLINGGMVLKQLDDKYFIAKDKGFGVFVRELPVRLTKAQIVSILEQGGYENLIERNHTIADLRKRLAEINTDDHTSGNVNVPLPTKRVSKPKRTKIAGYAKQINDIKNLVAGRRADDHIPYDTVSFSMKEMKEMYPSKSIKEIKKALKQGGLG